MYSMLSLFQLGLKLPNAQDLIATLIYTGVGVVVGGTGVGVGGTGDDVGVGELTG